MSGKERSVSDLLQELQTALERERLSLGELIEALQRKGPFFALLLLSVPFLQPVALPGVSTPFGLLIALLALGLLLRREMPLPAWIARFELGSKAVSMLFRGAIALFRRLERWTKPRRYGMLVERDDVRRLHALLLIVVAVLLMLPLPIPFSNSLPAYVVFFIALGYLQRDGMLMLVSYGFALLTGAYFALIATLGVEGFKLLAQGMWGG
ncbi:exopolysaccharide biosynthesis protein [Paenibacillus sp. TRM 82003]|nr:exopolysaccharide biosynthesis protein [Paenibacillus sp. TRM 82003]